MGNQKP